MTTEPAQETSSRSPVEGLSFKIFRGNETTSFATAHAHDSARKKFPPHPAVVRGLQRCAEHGNGATVRVLFSSPTMHVSYAWFKSGFPLPLHSHDADCFYQILAGSMQVGTEEVGKGDGILVPAGVPYTFAPGPDGVEFLEIRPTDDFGTQHRGTTDAYWDRIIEVRKSRQDAWATEQPPYGLVPKQP